MFVSSVQDHKHVNGGEHTELIYTCLQREAVRDTTQRTNISPCGVTATAVGLLNCAASPLASRHPPSPDPAIVTTLPSTAMRRIRLLVQSATTTPPPHCRGYTATPDRRPRRASDAGPSSNPDVPVSVCRTHKDESVCLWSLKRNVFAARSLKTPRSKVDLIGNQAL